MVTTCSNSWERGAHSLGGECTDFPATHLLFLLGCCVGFFTTLQPKWPATAMEQSLRVLLDDILRPLGRSQGEITGILGAHHKLPSGSHAEPWEPPASKASVPALLLRDLSWPPLSGSPGQAQPGSPVALPLETPFHT